MANVSRLRGFRPVKMLSGAPWNGKVTRYYVAAADATLIGVGDLVVLDGTADTNGVAAVTRAAANGVCVGPVVWVEPNPSDLTKQYRVASTAAYVYVADDSNIIMEAQEDADTSTIATSQTGANFNFVVADASTVTGMSGMQVDSNTGATTNTLPLRLMGFVLDSENEPGVANAKVLVMFNTHQYKSNTGSTGIA